MKSWNLFATGGRLRYPGFPPAAYVSMQVHAAVGAASGLYEWLHWWGLLSPSSVGLQTVTHRARTCFACLMHRMTGPPRVRSSSMCMPCVLAASRQTSSW
jgi:hypothetical protein